MPKEARPGHLICTIWLVERFSTTCTQQKHRSWSEILKASICSLANELRGCDNKDARIISRNVGLSISGCKRSKREQSLERIKWHLWHGNVFRALQVGEDLEEDKTRIC